MKEKLKKLLKDNYESQEDLALLLGITYQSVSIKINGHKDFRQSEIKAMMQHYRLTPEQVVDIFFTD